MSERTVHMRTIETYLNDNLDLEIKGDWQVFRFEYPVFDKGGNPVLDKDGKQVTKGRMLDFMGFQFHHDRTTIRKSNIEAARRKANHISKQDKISWYNASVMLSYAVYVFVKMPSDKQLNKVREWLLYAVTKAEKELGGGTGQIKLRYVYDMFVARFTWLARVISFEAFSMMVDEALERMKKMLESNKAMQTLVSGEAGETVEKDM